MKIRKFNFLRRFNFANRCYSVFFQKLILYFSFIVLSFETSKEYIFENFLHSPNSLKLIPGTQIVTSCKDKKFRIFDARSGVLLLWGHGHDGSRAQRVIFVMDDKYLLSCGFSPTNERQVGM